MRTIKFSLVILATLVTFGASAQIGIQAGYSYEKQTISFSSLSISNTLNGFHVGPVYEMTVQSPVSLQYGLLFNRLTGKDKNSETSTTETLMSLDLPVRVAVSFPIQTGLNAFVFGGPNFNYGLSYKDKTGSVTTDMYKMDENNDGKKDISRFDVQLGVGAGLKYNAITLRFSYDWGLLDRYTIDPGKFKANDMKISLAYMF